MSRVLFITHPEVRAEDQPGQGHWYAFDRDSRRVLSGCRPLD